MSHGILQTNQEGKYIGSVVTRSMNEHFWLEENQEKQNDKSPSHLIFAKAPSGHTYKAGLAYQYSFTRGEFSGEIGFNLLFNDPDFGEPVWFGSFPDRNGGYNLSLRRDTQQQAAA